MKKILGFLLIASMVFTMCACGDDSTNENIISTGNLQEDGLEITSEVLISLSIPQKLVDHFGAFEMTSQYSNSGDDILDSAALNTTFASNGGFYEVSEIVEYSDGYVGRTYFNSDSDDKYIYADNNGVYETITKDNETNDTYKNSLWGFTNETLVITSVSENSTYYYVDAEIRESEETVEKFEITIDKSLGGIVKVVSTIPGVKGEGDMRCISEIEYNSNLVADKSPKTGNSSVGDYVTEEEEDEPEVQIPSTVTGELQFSTVDVYGNPIDQDVILGAKVVLLNLWEPWCGPCVRELPELQKLYENYKDEGLLIIGAYQDYDDDALDLVEENGLTYPIVKVDSNLYKYEQSYVPATFAFDGNGNLLSSEPVAGSNSYDGWEAYILQFLK